MITFAVAMAEAYSTNASFNPGYLYVGTVLIDLLVLCVFQNLVEEKE